ncbi:MAG: hypothetical protein IJN25_08885 [Clostridia bacterium]|nr:hypothetical protein [Clostridia bacterium]
MRKAGRWFCMLAKRLLLRRSFVVLLLLIPLLLPAVGALMQGDSGVLRIALCAAGGENPGAEKIIASLTETESILRYTLYTSEEEARQAVAGNREDAAWIFAEDFENALGRYSRGESRRAVVTVVERETGISLQLSHEKLYGVLYPYIVRAAYDTFIETEFSGRIPAETADKVYEKTSGGRSVIRMEALHGVGEGEDANHLTVPLRGLLSLVVMLCGLAACMYYLEDRQSGRLDWLPEAKRIVPAIGSTGAALLFGGTAMVAALFAAGIGTGFRLEIAAMALFIVAAAGFCTVLVLLFRNPGTLGAALPFLLMTMLALCPVFFNMKILRPVRLLLPPYYYLQAIGNPVYLLYMILYCIAVFLAAGILHFLLNRHDFLKK